jgi:hypothetical protein
MKQAGDIIRELIEEDAYLRRREPEILRFYTGCVSVSKRGPQSVKDDAAAEPWTAGVESLS